jgi:hypothetical protein
MTTYTEDWPSSEREERIVTKRDLMRLLTAALATITVDPVVAHKTGWTGDEDVRPYPKRSRRSDPDNHGAADRSTISPQLTISEKRTI